MTRNALLPAVALALVAGHASAQVTFDLIDSEFFNYVGSSVSADGRVIVGNQYGSFETFRWEEGEGASLLGRGTVAVIGTGAGIPRVSNDGTRVSATIMNDDGTLAGAGVWTNGVWTMCEPLPPSAIPLDDFTGSAWAISGDGSTVVGLYWRVGKALPFSWSEATGGVDLAPVTAMTQSARANGCSNDGSVVAGWRALANGTWQPAVWENGVETILDPTLGFCEAFNVSHDGDMVMGQTWVNAFQRREAAVWRRTESGWEREILGSLPGTGAASVTAEACSADESIVVGINNFFDSGPFSPATGFIWTEATGMVDVVDFLEDNGVVLDPRFKISGLTDITPDGTVMIGYGYYIDTLDLQTFRITVAAPAPCPGDADTDNSVDFNDIVGILANWGGLTVPWRDGDTNGDCVVDFNDIVTTLANWGVECP